MYFQFHWLFPLWSLLTGPSSYFLITDTIFFSFKFLFGSFCNFSLSLIKCPIFFHTFLILHVLSNFVLYLRYHNHYVMETRFFYNSLKSVTWVCFSKKLTCLDPNCIFHLTAVGNSSNICLVLLGLPGLLKACHVHASFGDQRLGQSLYIKFGFPFLWLFLFQNYLLTSQ